ncbi:hypothetical protein K466DRAFT_141602 [Polyporus arcularius HHB13444]|uniref:Uncharacterized protein n=1 Tax=Polyporus arcularius HHB13444 TaxID=1314778 RepID=A0A5C3PL70_9APHY|nr:hypothetical protein K466DRAFT_141602 [Polyporus arcularius HHB13444]
MYVCRSSLIKYLSNFSRFFCPSVLTWTFGVHYAVARSGSLCTRTFRHGIRLSLLSQRWKAAYAARSPYQSVLRSWRRRQLAWRSRKTSQPLRSVASLLRSRATMCSNSGNFPRKSGTNPSRDGLGSMIHYFGMDPA